jgi:hypothetical protein
MLWLLRSHTPSVSTRMRWWQVSLVSCSLMKCEELDSRRFLMLLHGRRVMTAEPYATSSCSQSTNKKLLTHFLQPSCCIAMMCYILQRC